MAEAKKVKARVLLDGAYGKADDVVELTEAEAKAAAGQVDADKEAVAYAASLPQNQPKVEG